MSDETTLLPCPFCGSEAQVMRMDYGGTKKEWKVWGVWCVTDLHAEYSHGHFIDNYATEAEAIAAWNTRATYGTLTAEQVRELIAPHLHARPTFDFGRHGAVWGADFQAIADELNELGSGTCECIAEYAESPIDGKKIVLHRCSACHELMRPYMRYCPNCGARVRNE